MEMNWTISFAENLFTEFFPQDQDNKPTGGFHYAPH